MGSLSWIMWLGPVESQESLEEGGRDSESRKEK